MAAFDMERKSGETAVQWYNRLNQFSADLYAQMRKAKTLASEEANELEFARRRKRDADRASGAASTTASPAKK